MNLGRTSLLFSILVAVCSIASAASGQGEGLHSYFSQDDGRKATTLWFSPCDQNEGECESHELSCSVEDGLELTLIYSHVNIEKLASSLIVGTDGNMKARLLLSPNPTIVDIELHELRLYQNEVDGGWILALPISSIDDFFYAMTEQSTEGAIFEIGGEKLTLAPEPGDGAKLLLFKSACEQPQN